MWLTWARPNGVSNGARAAALTQAPASARKTFGTPFGEAAVSHVNLNDGVVEGVRLLDQPAFSVQYHPEAGPGPHDARYLFGEFCRLMEDAG